MLLLLLVLLYSLLICFLPLSIAVLQIHPNLFLLLFLLTSLLQFPLLLLFLFFHIFLYSFYSSSFLLLYPILFLHIFPFPLLFFLLFFLLILPTHISPQLTPLILFFLPLSAQSVNQSVSHSLFPSLCLSFSLPSTHSHIHFIMHSCAASTAVLLTPPPTATVIVVAPLLFSSPRCLLMKLLCCQQLSITHTACFRSASLTCCAYCPALPTLLSPFSLSQFVQLNLSALHLKCQQTRKTCDAPRTALPTSLSLCLALPPCQSGACKAKPKRNEAKILSASAWKMSPHINLSSITFDTLVSGREGGSSREVAQVILPLFPPLPSGCHSHFHVTQQKGSIPLHDTHKRITSAI